jgi:hypothetical protein
MRINATGQHRDPVDGVVDRVPESFQLQLRLL